MPPWFVELMKQCGHLSLDNERDQRKLWERLSESWPRAAIEAMISDNLQSATSHRDHEHEVARIHAAVIAALEES